MPTYRQILLKALNLTFRNPVLWFFGLFVAVLGTGAELGLLVQSSDPGNNQSIIGEIFFFLSQSGFFNPQSLLKLTQLMLTQPLTFLATILIFTLQLFLIVLFIWLVAVSQVAVVTGAANFIKNKRVSWIELFKIGVNQFWPVFLVNATFKIIVLGSMSLLTAIGVLTASKLFGSTILFFVAFTVLICLLLVISFLVRYLILFVILKGQTIRVAAQEAIKLFFQNWLLSLEVTAILFLIYSVINYCFVAVFEEFVVYALVARPDVFGWYLFFGLLVFAVIQTILALFSWISWTIVFQILINKQLQFSSRLNNAFRKIFH